MTVGCLRAEVEPTASLFIEEHTSDDHGGGSISNNILEDSTGAIFLANEAGLLKYDGKAWIRMPATNHASLVTSSALDPDGRIWITGLGSIGYYASDERGRYDYHDLTPSVRSLPEGSDLGTFWEVKHFLGGVFLITSNHVLRWKNEKWETWRFQDKRRILPSWCDDELYIHDRGDGLFRFAGDRFDRLVADTPEIASGIIAIIDQTERGLLCVTVSNGLFWLKERTFTPVESDINSATITHASMLRNGNLAIGTADQGLIILDQNGTLTHKVSTNRKPIYKCLESSYGSIWVVASEAVYEIKHRFLTFWDENTQDLLKANDRIYYTTGLQLKSIRPQDRGARQPVEVIDEASSLWAITLATEEEELVYGTASEFRALDSRGAKTQTSSPRPIASIFPSRAEPDVLYTSDVPRLSRWKKQGAHWEMQDTLHNFNSGAVSLVELPDSKLLISDTNGSLLLANASDKAASGGDWTVLRTLGAEHGLPDAFIWAYCLRIRETVVVISDQGLHRYDPEPQTFRHDPVLGDDLGSDAFGLESCPLPDGSGWALRLESQDSQGKQKNLVGRLTLGNGGRFKWQPWNLPSLDQAGKVEALLHETPGGEEVLWVGGSRRLLRYELSDLPPFEPLATAITTIRERTAPANYFAGAGAAKETYEWDFPQQSLRIEYAASPSAIRVEGYQTRLIGFNDNWSEVSPDTFNDFTNLHEGDYRFEVRAVDEFGRRGTTQSFSFRIHPPWYRTPYAYAGAGFTLAFVVWGLIRLRNRHLLKRNEELEKLINERTYKVERQKLELERANRTKQNFLASMSHEIRNPLNGILGIARLMHQREAQSGNESKEVAHLYTSTKHLHQLLGQTLDYSSLESGKLHARSETFEARKLVDEVVEMHRSMADSKGLRLESVRPERPCHWKGDPVLLRQVLINLVSNAIKYTKEGSVTLKLHHQELEDSVLATFEVTDTGPGIPGDKRSYIFEEFTRLTLPGEDNIPGTGLGLAIASEMSKLMGGTLRLDPDHTGGARFALDIELEPDLHAQVHSKRPEDAFARIDGQKALVADDLDFNRYVHAEVLKRMGASAEIACNGREALQHLQQHSFDIALLDVNMPGMNGFEVVRRYLAESPGKPPVFFALSAYNTPDMESKCLNAGFDHFLEKPLEPSKLISRLEHRPVSEPPPGSGIMEYIANGDSTALAKLEANYQQSLDKGIAEFLDARSRDDLHSQKDALHKLIGLSCMRTDGELTRALSQLSEALKNAAPTAEVEALIRQVLGRIRRSDAAKPPSPTLHEDSPRKK